MRLSTTITSSRHLRWAITLTSLAITISLVDGGGVQFLVAPSIANLPSNDPAQAQAVQDSIYFNGHILYWCSALLEVILSVIQEDNYGNMQYVFGTNDINTEAIVNVRLQYLQSACDDTGPDVSIWRSEADLYEQNTQVTQLVSILTGPTPTTTTITTTTNPALCTNPPRPGQSVLPGYTWPTMGTIVLCPDFWNLKIMPEDDCWEQNQVGSLLSLFAELYVVMNTSPANALRPIAYGQSDTNLPENLLLSNADSYGGFAQQIGNGCSFGVQVRNPPRYPPATSPTPTP